MTRNVGSLDRLVRAFAAASLVALFFLSSLPTVARAIAFALPAGYMLFTALQGTCFGYRLMGRSTCPTQIAREPSEDAP